MDVVHQTRDFSSELMRSKFDFILCNFVLLHLDDAQVRRLFIRVERLMTSKSIFLIKETCPTTSYIED